MDIAEAIRSVDTFDLFAAFGLMVMFILGYIQGAVRRLLGIASILFSFFVAAQLREPVGGFLAENWTYFPEQYSYMVGFGAMFVASSIAFTIVIQAYYRVVPLFQRYPIVDELLGGFLGLVQGAIILGAIIMILDPFYGLPYEPFRDEAAILRSLYGAYDTSLTAGIFRDQLLPGFIAVFGALIPDAVEAAFPAAS